MKDQYPPAVIKHILRSNCKDAVMTFILPNLPFPFLSGPNITSILGWLKGQVGVRYGESCHLSGTVLTMMLPSKTVPLPPPIHAYSMSPFCLPSAPNSHCLRILSNIPLSFSNRQFNCLRNVTLGCKLHFKMRFVRTNCTFIFNAVFTFFSSPSGLKACQLLTKRILLWIYWRALLFLYP